MKTTIKQLKNALSEIEFYTQFPTMIPFVGDYYISDQHKKMLLVGESFYFPNASTIHKDADKWYNAKQKDLGIVIEDGKPEKEIEWIDCDGLLRSDWSADGHAMYKNINTAIKEVLTHYHNRPIDEIAYTNFFVRPALRGLSFNEYKKYGDITEDVKYANKVLENVINILAPNLLVFVSKSAFDTANKAYLNANPNLNVEFVCHPADPFHWPKKKYPHNKEKFLRILKEKFVN